jgi:hypothetical protein
MTTNKRLSATITIGGAVAGTLTTAFGQVKGKLGEIGKTVTDLTKRQKLLGKAIQEFARAGKDVDGLRASYARLTAQIDRARHAQKRLADAQKFKETSAKIGAALNGAAVRTGAGGLALGGALYTGVRAAVGRENEVNIIRNSGLSKSDQDALISAASGSRQFGVSVTDSFKTARELQASLGSAAHAIEALPTALKAKSGLQLYNREHAGHEIGDDAMYSLAKIADERGGATSAEEMRRQMNFAFKGITASQGKVSAEDWLNAQRGAKAAGIGMTNDAFFGDSFMVQALGAPQYGKALSTLNNAWIGGHQDAHKFTNMLADGLLDRTKVKLKNGLVTNYKSDALVDSKLFIKDQQAWAEKYLVPLAKRKGIDLSDSAAVQKFASDYTSNTNAGNVLFQRLFNRTAIDRDRKNYLSAHGIDESDSANRASTAGKQENLRARLEDAQVRIGTALLPAFTTAMEKTASALESVNKFAEENPRLFKAITVGLGATAAALIVVTPLLLAANGVLTTIAAVKLARAASEVASVTKGLESVGPAAATAGGGILGLVGKIGSAIGLIGVALEAAKLLGLPDTNSAKGAADIRSGKWLAASADLPAATFLRAMAARAGGKSNADIAASLDADQNPAAKQPPKIPAPASSAKAAPTISSNDTYTFNLQQLPGQSADDFADIVIRKMNKKTAVQQRSVLFDGAAQ